MLRKDSQVIAGCRLIILIFETTSAVRAVEPRPLTEIEIAEALTALKSPDSASREKGAEALRGVPCADLGPPLVQLLAENAGFQLQETRRLSFDLMSTCHGQKGKSVESALLRERKRCQDGFWLDNSSTPPGWDRMSDPHHGFRFAPLFGLPPWSPSATHRRPLRGEIAYGIAGTSAGANLGAFLSPL